MAGCTRLGGGGLKVEHLDDPADQRKRITPHLLRHNFSRWSLDAGINISYLQHQLGHFSLTTTAIYLQARPNHREEGL